jgi:hypothetical protein
LIRLERYNCGSARGRLIINPFIDIVKSFILIRKIIPWPRIKKELIVSREQAYAV